MAEWTYRSARHWTDWSKVRGDYERSRDELTRKIERPDRGDAPTREKQLSDLAEQGADLASTLDGKAVRLAGAPPASPCEGDTAGPSPVAEDEVLFFVGVEDVAATLSRAQELGGTIIQPAQQVPGTSFGVFADAQGHRIGVASAAA